MLTGSIGTTRRARRGMLREWRLPSLSVFSLAVAFVCLGAALLVLTNLHAVEERWAHAGRASDLPEGHGHAARRRRVPECARRRPRCHAGSLRVERPGAHRVRQRGDRPGRRPSRAPGGGLPGVAGDRRAPRHGGVGARRHGREAAAAPGGGRRRDVPVVDRAPRAPRPRRRGSGGAPRARRLRLRCSRSSARRCASRSSAERRRWRSCASWARLTAS